MLATPKHPEWQTRSATHSGPTSSICGHDGVIDAVDLLGLTWAFIINDNTVERDLVLQIIAHPDTEGGNPQSEILLETHQSRHTGSIQPDDGALDLILAITDGERRLGPRGDQSRGLRPKPSTIQLQTFATTSPNLAFSSIGPNVFASSMNDLLPILIPGLAAALAAILVTLAIERLGGQLGGILGTLPLTVVPASLGLFHADPRADVFATAMSAIPLGMLLNAAFLGVWRVWPIRAGNRSTVLMETLGLSLGFWIIAALVLVVVREALSPNMNRDVLVGVVALVNHRGVGRPRLPQRPPAPKGNRRVGIRVLLLRGLALEQPSPAVWRWAEQGG